MDAYEFMSGNPWMTFWLSLMVVTVIHYAFRYCINRPLRSLNIKRHGWPPEHLDADGDFKSEDAD